MLSANLSRVFGHHCRRASRVRRQSQTVRSGCLTCSFHKVQSYECVAQGESANQPAHVLQLFAIHTRTKIDAVGKLLRAWHCAVNEQSKVHSSYPVEARDQFRAITEVHRVATVDGTCLRSAAFENFVGQCFRSASRQYSALLDFSCIDWLFVVTRDLTAGRSTSIENARCSENLRKRRRSEEINAYPPVSRRRVVYHYHLTLLSS